MSVINVDSKLEGYPRGEKLFGSECITKVGTSVVNSDGKIYSSVGIPVGILYGDLEGSTLGRESLGANGISEIQSSNGRS